MGSGIYERKNHFTYTVYDCRTDFPLVIGGTAKECAAAMGITLHSFRTIYTKLKNGNTQATRKWEIFRDAPGDKVEEEGE